MQYLKNAPQRRPAGDRKLDPGRARGIEGKYRYTMNRILLLLLIFTIAVTGCKTFINDEYVLNLREMEKKEFILLEDLINGDKLIKKDEAVKIIITKGSDWIKAEAYSAKIGKLKADRIRILFLFEDDFPDKKFSMEFFNNRLLSMIKIK